MIGWRKSGHVRELWFLGPGQQTSQEVFLGKVFPAPEGGLWRAESRTGEEVAASPHMGEAMVALRQHHDDRRRRLAEMEADAR